MVNNKIHTALNDIAMTQASPPKNTNDAKLMLMDYLHTHPDTKIRYYASDIQSYIDSDVAYFVAPKAKSRIGGHVYLSDNFNQSKKYPSPKINAPIHIKCRLLKHVVSSAAESGISAIFHNCIIAISLRIMLEALGHQQIIIPLKTDNSTAEAFSNSTLKG